VVVVGVAAVAVGTVVFVAADAFAHGVGGKRVTSGPALVVGMLAGGVVGNFGGDMGAEVDARDGATPPSWRVGGRSSRRGGRGGSGRSSGSCGRRGRGISSGRCSGCGSWRWRRCIGR
jgi:hypothetical protein